MKNKAAGRASLKMLIVGAAVLAGVFALCLVLLLGWILQTPVTEQRDEVTVTMPRTGGLFKGSAATYRGVRVGEVTDIRLGDSGVEVTVRLVADHGVPRASRAKVRSLSPVGEQYIDFRPKSPDGPMLDDGDTIRANAKDLPVSIAKMVTALQKTMRQVDPDKVRTVLREVNTAFEGSDDDLRKLLANTESLLETVDETWPTAVDVLEQGKTSLEIFADNKQVLVRWAASAATVGTWFQQWNPQVREIFERLPDDLGDVLVLVDGVDRRLPALLEDVNALSSLLARHGPHLRATLKMTPYGLGRFASVMRDGYMWVTANLNGQRTCNYGSEHTEPTTGREGRKAPNTKGQCGQFPWRGANHAPPPLPE